MIKELKKRYKAVTLVELLVVISIIGILAGVSVVSLQSARTSSRLKAAQREVASQIKLAQSYALQGRAQSGIVPCGYGFRFKDAGTYEIFYNIPTTTGSCSAKNSGADPVLLKRFLHFSTEATPDDSRIFESQTLNNGVTLSSELAKTEIYFTVPHGKIYDKDGAMPSTDNILEFDFGETKKTISISSGGKIVEN